MRSPLLLALALAPLACGGAEPAPVTPPPVVLAAPPVVVNLDPPPAPSAAPAAAPTAAPTAAPGNQRDAAEFGVIGLLGSSDDPNAPTTPWGKDDSTAKGNMWGDSIGDSFGAGGLGIVGGGGAGGTGVGLGNIGTLGHGASHKGAKVTMGATTVTGRLPPEVIQRIVRQNFGRFRLCYEKGLTAKPTLEGKVEVKFTIDKQGSVVNVTSGAGTAMPDPTVTACVIRAFGGLSFPEPEEGTVAVVYPIRFTPGEPAAAAPAAKKP